MTSSGLTELIGREEFYFRPRDRPLIDQATTGLFRLRPSPEVSEDAVSEGSCCLLPAELDGARTPPCCSVGGAQMMTN